MTAKQRAARAKFKAVVAEAKKLRKKNPKLTQAQAVKQAFAISYSKKRAGVGTDMISKYNVGDEVYSYQNKDKAAKIIYKRFVPYESLSKPNKKDKYVYKLKLDEGFSNYINEDSLSRKKISGVGAVKKKAATKVKAKKSKRTSEMHTDTKSHNVNIRVISGINSQYIKDLKEIDEKLQKWILIRSATKNALNDTKDPLSKTLFRNDLYRIKNVIEELKERMNKIKRQIK